MNIAHLTSKEHHFRIRMRFETDMKQCINE